MNLSECILPFRLSTHAQLPCLYVKGTFRAPGAMKKVGNLFILETLAWFIHAGECEGRGGRMEYNTLDCTLEVVERRPALNVPLHKNTFYANRKIRQEGNNFFPHSFFFWFC